MNYGEMKSQFLGLMNRRDLTASATLPDTFLQQAISRAQRKLRVPAMEQAAEVEWDSEYDNGLFPIPTDLLEVKEMSYLGSAQTFSLRKRDVNSILQIRQGASNAGVPKFYARRGAYWILDRDPAAGDVIRLDYYGEFDALSEDEDSNFLTEIMSDVIIDGAMHYACKYYKDERAKAYERDFINGLDEVQEQADRDELNGSSHVAPAYNLAGED